MEHISGVVGYLNKELKRAQQEVQRFTTALAALGSSSSNGAPYIVGVGSEADQPRSKKAMGNGPEWIEASSDNCSGSCETHTNNLSGG
jgi:hypothetical protein